MDQRHDSRKGECRASGSATDDDLVHIGGNILRGWYVRRRSRWHGSRHLWAQRWAHAKQRPRGADGDL